MTEETQPATPPADLTIVDLQNLRSIIDVAARRGAFAAAEMTSVGTVFNKLDNFLTAVAPPQQPQAEQPTT
jgi:hypothetical protein